MNAAIPDAVCWTATTGGLDLRVLVQPRAARTAIVGPHGEPARLKIRIAAPPADGEANHALIQFVAQWLGIPRSRVVLVRGASSRQKDLRCEGVTAQQVAAALSSALDNPTQRS